MREFNEDRIHQLVNLYISKSSKTFDNIEDFYKYYDECYKIIKNLNSKLCEKLKPKVVNL